MVARVEHQRVTFLDHQAREIERPIAMPAEEGVASRLGRRSDFALDFEQRFGRRQTAQPARAHRGAAGDQRHVFGRPAVQAGEHLAHRNARRPHRLVNAPRIIAADLIQVALRGAVVQVVPALGLHALLDQLLLPVGVAVAEVDDVATPRERAHQIGCAQRSRRARRRRVCILRGARLADAEQCQREQRSPAACIRRKVAQPAGRSSYRRFRHLAFLVTASRSHLRSSVNATRQRRPAASSSVSCAAGTFLQPLAFWPDHKGEKSPDPKRSA